MANNLVTALFQDQIFWHIFKYKIFKEVDLGAKFYARIQFRGQSLVILCKNLIKEEYINWGQNVVILRKKFPILAAGPKLP